MIHIAITNLSVVTSENAEQTFTSDIGNVKGCYSIDAPTAYFLKKLHQKGQTLDKIICLATPETLKIQKPMEESAYDIYKNTVKRYSKEIGCHIPEVLTVKLEFGKTNMNHAIHDILKMLPDNAEIYLDTTGGARNTSYILLLLTRFLAYSGIKLRQAVYGNNHEHCIEDITALYNMFSLINAANTFTAFGNAHELKAFFQNAESLEITRLLNAMAEFSDAVMLCDTHLDLKIKELKDCFLRMNEYKAKNEAESLFCLLMDTIRQKLYLSDERSDLPYPKLIRWCIENSLIQQAVTIYTEKIPEYLFKERIIRITKKIHVCQNNGFSEEYTLFYSELYNLSSKHSEFHDALSKCISTDERRYVFYHCQTLQDFFRKTDIVFSPESKEFRLLDKFIKLKNCLFDFYTLEPFDNKRRTNKIMEYTEYPEFQVLYKRAATITAIDRYFNSVMNDRSYGDLLQGIIKKKSPKPETILRLETYLTPDSGFAAADGISMDMLRNFMIITLFIKTNIRNALNHASGNREEIREDFEALSGG